ncbi:hypothetical protein ARMSODRAFT_978253 [Armillaria solidipes]|uniref:Uncharacterized protein n=1 Tax=Armillaria solidipes TaxID=1076256 RepID=A0A2H3BHD1_9AGAR|nr:hypothetical protein ARMSODRAFT_978253 [Armillaria solidipes]
MSGTMTRSKKRATELASMPTAADPQEPHQGSTGANVIPDDARVEAEPATEHPHSTNPDLANSSGLDQVETADTHNSDKPNEEEQGWREPPSIPNSGSDTICDIKDKLQSDRPLKLEAIPEADNAAESEFGIAEFESN